MKYAPPSRNQIWQSGLLQNVVGRYGVVAAGLCCILCLLMAVHAGLSVDAVESDWLEVRNDRVQSTLERGSEWMCDLTNVTESKVTVLRVQGSCTCFQIKLDRSAVPVNGSMRLVARSTSTPSIGENVSRVISIILRFGDGRLRQEEFALTTLGIRRTGDRGIDRQAGL